MLQFRANQLINFNQANVRSISFFGFGKKKVEEDLTTELSDTKVSIWEDLGEEEVEKIRNKSRLTTKERDQLVGKLSERIYLNELYQYKTPYVRNLYAKFGKETGFKPGVCWPRKDELEFKKKYEETFYPSLEQLMKELADEKAAELKEIKEREKEVRKGLKKLAKYKQDFFERYNQRKSEMKEKEDKEAKRIEEICDFLGYALSPKDPRFAAAAEKKADLERKEQLKLGIVKKTRQQKMLEELQELIEANKAAEQKKLEEQKSEEDKEVSGEQVESVKQAKAEDESNETKSDDKVKKKKKKDKVDEQTKVDPKDE